MPTSCFKIKKRTLKKAICRPFACLILPVTRRRNLRSSPLAGLCSGRNRELCTAGLLTYPSLPQHLPNHRLPCGGRVNQWSKVAESLAGGNHSSEYCLGIGAVRLPTEFPLRSVAMRADTVASANVVIFFGTFRPQRVKFLKIINSPRRAQPIATPAQNFCPKKVRIFQYY